MITESRIEEIKLLGPSSPDRKIVYTPTHFDEKPAVLAIQSFANGSISYAVIQNESIVFTECGNFREYLNKNFVQKAWGEALENVVFSTIDSNNFIFDFSKTAKRLTPAVLSSQPKCFDSEHGEECDHQIELVRNINMEIANNLLKTQHNPAVKIEGKKTLLDSMKHDKGITVDWSDEINKIIGISSVNGKMTILMGSTGTGKTRSVNNYAKANQLDMFMTTVGQDGNFRKALYGENDVENDEHGNIGITKTPGPMIEALRNIRDNRRPSLLFIDEAFRSEGMGIFTLFSPSEENGVLYYDIKGIDKQRFLFVKNEISSGWVLATKESSHLFDGKILKEIPRSTTKENLVSFAIHGIIPRVNKKDLEENGYKIVSTGDIFQERFQVPLHSIQLVIAGNYGTNYDMANRKLDDAVFNRSNVLAIDLLSKTPKELMSVIKGEKTSNIVRFIPISKLDRERISQSFVEFYEGIKNGIQDTNLRLPRKAYNYRNMADILNIDHYPANYKDPCFYIADLIENYLKYNYIESNVGRENIEANKVQQGYLETIISAAFNLPENPSLKFSDEIGGGYSPSPIKTPGMSSSDEDFAAPTISSSRMKR